MSSDPDPVESIVEEVVLGRLRGEEVDVEAALAQVDEPALRDAVRRRLATLDAFQARLDEVAQRPGPGRELGDFRILAEIGRGGMGIVYLAHQTSLDRRVALKVLPELSSLASERVRRFLREGTTLATLQHPNIVRVVSAGRDEGILYLAMEYVDGTDLDAIHEALVDVPPRERTAHAFRGVLTKDGVADRDGEPSYVRLVARLFAGVADALAYAHSHGVLHRDVKPSNILVTTDGTPKLVDFGLAHHAEREALTRSTDILGSPAYLAPEVIRSGVGAATTRTDVYALGVCLYETLSGARPFDSSSVAGLLREIELGAARPLRSLNDSVPRDLQTICHKAMERDPDARYVTADALAEDLRSFLDYRPIAARSPGPIRRLRLLTLRHRRGSIAVAGVFFVAVGILMMTLAREWARAVETERTVVDARQAVEREDVESARAALDRLGALAPHHTERDALRTSVALLACDRALAAAAEELREVEVLRAERVRLEPPDTPFRLQRYLEPAMRRTAIQGENRYAELELELEQAYVRVLDRLSDAEKHAVSAGRPDHPALLRGYAEVYVTRWRTALRERDETSLRVFADLVRRYDREGRFEQELVGTSRVSIDAPADASVDLFRYVPEREAQPDGWQCRLVPVPALHAGNEPFSIDAVDFSPGDTCLVLTEPPPAGPLEAAGLTQGDLILSVDGWPAGEGLYVGAVDAGGVGARLGVRPFDRVVAIDGRPVESGWEVEVAEQLGSGDFLMELQRFGEPAHGVSFARQGAGSLDVDLMTAAELLRAGTVERPIPIVALRDGRVVTLELEPGVAPGLRVAATAYPLVRCAESRAGSGTVEGLELEPGSYLALVGGSGLRDLRVPFCVGRGSEQRVLAAPLAADAEAPPGCVWVPGGDFVTRALSGPDDPAPRTAHVEGFWVQRREVTVEDWAEFLWDPAIQQRIAELEERGELALVPRYRPLGDPMWSRVSPGAYVHFPMMRQWPVNQISYLDIEAYVAWLDARLAADGKPWRVAVPTGVEWEWAAAGADGRGFPWGDEFDGSLCKSGFARPEYNTRKLQAEPGLRFLTDESPFGVHDMAGSVAEWLDEVDTENSDMQHYCGGAWIYIEPEAFRIDFRGSDLRSALHEHLGLRLVFRPREQGAARER